VRTQVLYGCFFSSVKPRTIFSSIAWA